ncbi:MAG: hypothetical protein ACI8S6_004459, partial [Myxococcota bacterium]
LNALIKGDPSDILFSEVELALTEQGSAASAPVLDYLQDSPDEQRDRLLSLVARAGVRDERIRDLLIEAMPSNPMLLASAAAQYGDPALLPALSQALDRTPTPDPDPDTFFASFGERQNIVELTAAIEELGGTLSASQQAKSKTVALQIELWRLNMGLPKFDLQSLLGD